MDVYLYGPDLSRMPGLTEIPDISSNRKLTPRALLAEPFGHPPVQARR